MTNLSGADARHDSQHRTSTRRGTGPPGASGASGRDLTGYIHQLLPGHLRTPTSDSDETEGANGGAATLEDRIDYEAIESVLGEVEGKDVPYD